MDNCIFCKIINKEIPSTKVYESDRVIAFLDINPIEKGHMLIVPKQHWKNLADVKLDTEKEIEIYEELMYIVRVAAKAVIITKLADGANILQCNNACAGQTVDHLHFHVIPRYGSELAAVPAFNSGAAKYESNEAQALAEKLSSAIAAIVKDEELL